MTEASAERAVVVQADVPAPIDDVWAAWTTEEGATTFFAPRCRVEARPGGAYEMYFNPAAPAGEQGGEGMIVLAVQGQSLLSFTWNAPPHLLEARAQMTHVTVRLTELNAGRTRVVLRHDGWGDGGEWDQAFAYFERAWNVVLPRLVHRFAVGPIDWSDPPRPETR